MHTHVLNLKTWRNFTLFIIRTTTKKNKQEHVPMINSHRTCHHYLRRFPECHRESSVFVFFFLSAKVNDYSLPLLTVLVHQVFFSEKQKKRKTFLRRHTRQSGPISNFTHQAEKEREIFGFMLKFWCTVLLFFFFFLDKLRLKSLG